MYASFRDQLAQARKDVARDQPMLLELTTTWSATPTTARRMGLDLTLGYGSASNAASSSSARASSIRPASPSWATFACKDRYLTRDTELLIHERRLERTLQLSGALRSNLALLNDAIAEIESGQRLEREGFAQLVGGQPAGCRPAAAEGAGCRLVPERR